MQTKRHTSKYFFYFVVGAAKLLTAPSCSVLSNAFWRLTSVARGQTPEISG